MCTSGGEGGGERKKEWVITNDNELLKDTDDKRQNESSPERT